MWHRGSPSPVAEAGHSAGTGARTRLLKRQQFFQLATDEAREAGGDFLGSVCVAGVSDEVDEPQIANSISRSAA